MNPNEITLISQHDNAEKIEEFLKSFLDKFIDKFNLLELTSSGQWTFLWNQLFNLLKNTETKLLCLQAIRILSRDKMYLNETVKEEEFDLLLELASIGVGDQDFPPEVQVEALKILCNLVYQSCKCQEFCLKNSAVEGILKRLRMLKEYHINDDIRLFDMRLLFLITALTPNVRSKVRDDYHGLIYLVETLDFMMKKNSIEVFENHEINIINEILKVLYNITETNLSTVETEEDDAHQLQRLTIMLNDLLRYKAHSTELTEDLYSYIINLLTSIPVSCYVELFPSENLNISKRSDSQFYESHDIHCVNIFIHFLDKRLKNFNEGKQEENLKMENISKEYENIPPILIVMIKSVQCSSAIRHYVKSKILPPLQDVKNRPEHGTEMRNILCQLLTYPSAQISDLVAEFLFILCKENVDRMIKYTGYGNAAGIFAKRGLLAGQNTGNHQQYSSDSEESDTEEYIKYKHSINPIIGCYETPQKNPLEGLSEEQKEYEAEQLVNLIDKLHRKGIVKPCKIADGKPVPIEHVLELQQLPKEHQEHNENL
ncbi:CLUMA_CG020947, isoform A [Clunio marinus]|uniref:CLUMA_CG020947, isoform A n=1 Tax=Clunio marinus TaxID=568069 RepID=A0A1J1J803_9DIPT|nr:CLUMA_CG020947, isoform A [Clunio marinus]